MDHLSASSYTRVTNFQKYMVFIGPPCTRITQIILYYCSNGRLSEFSGLIDAANAFAYSILCVQLVGYRANNSSLNVGLNARWSLMLL